MGLLRHLLLLLLLMLLLVRWRLMREWLRIECVVGCMARLAIWARSIILLAIDLIGKRNVCDAG